MGSHRVYKNTKYGKVKQFSVSPSTKVNLHFLTMQLSADVFACNVNPDTHMVEALDTWNDNSYNNAPNVDQSNITLLSGSFSDGRIVCR